MNIGTIATYAGWALLAVFVITILVLGYMLYKDRDQTKVKDKKDPQAKKETKAEQKAAKQFLKEQIHANGVPAKRAKKDLDLGEKDSGLLANTKVRPTGFAVEGMHTAEDISHGLADLNGAKTTNPFRDRADEVFVPAPQPTPSFQTSPTLAPAPVQQPVTPPARPPVTPVSGLPKAPQRPSALPSQPANSKVSGPPKVEGSLPPNKLFASRESREQQ